MYLCLKPLLFLLLHGRTLALEAIAATASHSAVGAVPVIEAGLDAAVGLPAHCTLENDRIGLIWMEEAGAAANGPPRSSRQPWNREEVLDLVRLAWHFEGELRVGEGAAEDDLGTEELLL